MTNASAALAQSVQARLVRHANTLGVDPNLVLTRFARERFLYRLSRSPHAERFVLKGALLLLVWLGEKQAQWARFLKKNRLSSARQDLGQVVERLARFLGPVIDAARRGSDVDLVWRPRGPWQPSKEPRA